MASVDDGNEDDDEVSIVLPEDTRAEAIETASPNDHPLLDSIVSVGVNVATNGDGQSQNQSQSQTDNETETETETEKQTDESPPTSAASLVQAFGAFHSSFRSISISINNNNSDINNSNHTGSERDASRNHSYSSYGEAEAAVRTHGRSARHSHPSETARFRCLAAGLLASIGGLAMIATLTASNISIDIDIDSNSNANSASNAIATPPTFWASVAILPVLACLGVLLGGHEVSRAKRERALLATIQRSEAIVDGLFPEIVRDRILEEGNLLVPAVESEAEETGSKGKSKSKSKGKPGCGRNSPVGNQQHQQQEQQQQQQQQEHQTARKDGPVTTSFVPLSSSSKSSPSLSPLKRIASIASSASTTYSRSDSNASLASSTGSECRGHPYYQHDHDRDRDHDHDHEACSSLADTRRIPSFSSSSSTTSSKPIADYFPSATILFADIVGFTSWASIRDPAQVFELLETVYGRFDEIATKKGVFKVETVGDCYVAATGLPRASGDHAVVMASFARRCLESMLHLLREPPVSLLGPGTADLGMRFGIHSGSVIGGVLRGKKSRYQLFGDTINTASRIESTSQKNKIHLSEQTAELLIAAGKKPWVEPRKETIVAKGKGELQTYWLTTEGPKNLSAREQLALPALLKMMAKANIDPGFIQTKRPIDPNEKLERLIDYHTHVLERLLHRLEGMRLRTQLRRTGSVRGGGKGSLRAAVSASASAAAGDEPARTEEPIPAFPTTGDGMLLFPTETSVSFRASTATVAATGTLRIRDSHGRSSSSSSLSSTHIDPIIAKQLRELVSRVAGWYRNLNRNRNRDDRSHHSFEHASHSVLAMTKLFAAVETKTNHKTSSSSSGGGKNKVQNKIQSNVPDSIRDKNKHGEDDSDRPRLGSLEVLTKTRAMLAHPMTQFVLVFAALVRDARVDGDEEKSANAGEGPQPGFVRRVWSLWAEPAFRDLRRCLCKTPEDLDFFGRLLVRCVSATGNQSANGAAAIATNPEIDGSPREHATPVSLRDPEASANANANANNANANSNANTNANANNANANANAMAIVEQLLLVANASHALQHFSVFRKWNGLSFREAEARGHCCNRNPDRNEDPSRIWYLDELELFDERILLAKKLRSSGVFDETIIDVYVNAGIANKREWEQNGTSIIREYLSDRE